MTDGGERDVVLVANADETVREVLARIVTEADLDAVRLDPAVDVPDAVVATSAAALILDRGSDNLAVLEAVRARSEAIGAGVRVIVIGTGPANGRLAIGAGADGFLVRPFHARDLQEAVQEAIGRSESRRHSWRAATTAALLQP